MFKKVCIEGTWLNINLDKKNDNDFKITVSNKITGKKYNVFPNDILTVGDKHE
jgi:hypothetical protein